MKTIVYKINTSNSEKCYKEAAAIIKSGGLVAFPTETVYGLGADALNVNAANKIYAAKGRPSDNPLIVHVTKKEEILPLVHFLPEKAERLIDVFLPGALTLILKKSDIVPFAITGGLDTVAIRIPSHPAAQKLIKECGCPIAAPSANTSGKPSTTEAEHVFCDMDSKIEMILDGGSCGIGLESTIIDMSQDVPAILRPGAITKDMIESVIGTVEAAENHAESESPPKSPGMKYTHYSPHAPLTIICGEESSFADKINALTITEHKAGKKVGVLATNETYALYNADTVFSVGSRKNPNDIAANLFSVLRKFDDTDVDIIYSEAFAKKEIGAAIMNRLTKAAGHKVMFVD